MYKVYAYLSFETLVKTDKEDMLSMYGKVLFGKFDSMCKPYIQKRSHVCFHVLHFLTQKNIDIRKCYLNCIFIQELVLLSAVLANQAFLAQFFKYLNHISEYI